MRGLPIVTLLLVCLALTACSKKKPPGPPPFEALCETSCERVSECNAEVDDEQCRIDCVSALMPYGDHLRVDLVDEIEQCMLDTRCRDLGVTALDNSCRRDATERIGVSLKTIEMCESLNDTLARCTLGDPRRGVEGCQQAFKILNDETLDEAIHCRDVECKELGNCFKAALGFMSPLMPAIPAADDSDEQP